MLAGQAPKCVFLGRGDWHSPASGVSLRELLGFGGFEGWNFQSCGASGIFEVSARLSFGRFDVAGFWSSWAFAAAEFQTF